VPSDETRTAPNKPERHVVVRLSFECSSGKRMPDVPGFSSRKVAIRSQRPGLSESLKHSRPGSKPFLMTVPLVTNITNQSPSSGNGHQVKETKSSIMRASCNRWQTNYSTDDDIWCFIFQT